MEIRKTIGTIVLMGALALSNIGCSRSHLQYHYSGKIGEEQVTFTEKSNGFGYDVNTLTITKADGRIIEYEDSAREDLKLECVRITRDGQTRRYAANDEVGRLVLEEAQNQFERYLLEIRKVKIQERHKRISEGLKNIK